MKPAKLTNGGISPIPIDGDTLISDAQLATEWNMTRRTLSRYDHKGLPFVLLGGVKYRPHKACRDWLATRIHGGR